MSSNSGHLLDALRGRQPDDDDPEQRLASQWRAAADTTPPLDEAALRRARQRRVVSGAGATEDSAQEPMAAAAVPDAGSEAEAVSSGPAEESGGVKRTRIVAAPEATRPQADAPRRGALERLGGVGRAVAAGLGGRGDRQGEVPADPEVTEHAAAPKARSLRDRGGKGRVTLSHSEAMLFVLVALVVVLSAYVIGKNNAGEANAGAKPATLSSAREVELGPDRPIDEKFEGDPSPVVNPTPPTPEVAAGGFGVRVTSYADAEEADKQARVFREELVAGQEVSIIARKNSRGREEFHLMVGRAEKKDDPSLAALAEKFRTLARGSQRPYERSVDIQGY